MKTAGLFLHPWSHKVFWSCVIFSCQHRVVVLPWRTSSLSALSGMVWEELNQYPKRSETRWWRGRRTGSTIIPESQGKPRLFFCLITLDAHADQSPFRDLGQHFNKRDQANSRLVVKLRRADNTSESYSRQETHYRQCSSPLPVEVYFQSFKYEPFIKVSFMAVICSVLWFVI